MRRHITVILLYTLLLCSCISNSQLDDVEISPESDEPYSSHDSIDLQGKTIWTIWDSLGDDSNWQPLFAELSGAIYYPDLNNRYLSLGGTNSNPASFNGTQARCRRLVGLKDKYPIDIVFLENINDMSYCNSETGIEGSPMDLPFMMKEKIVAHRGAIPSYEEAKQYLDAKLDSIVESVPQSQRQIGALMTVPYKDNSVRGVTIEIIADATCDGDILVMIGNNTIDIPVRAGMGAENILQSLLWGGDVPGWSVVDNGDNTLTLSFYTNTDTPVSIDENGTGCQIKITEDKATKEMVVYYLGNSSSGWCSKDNWVMDLSLYSIYKGVIEYLQEELPTDKLFWVIPSYYDVDCEDTLLLDDFGNYCWEKYIATDSYKRWSNVCKVQKVVCKLYGIPVLDISDNCGININNFLEYYNCGNVHPKKEGYERWAETLYDMMK